MGLLKDQVVAPFAEAAESALRRREARMDLVEAGVVVQASQGVAEVRDLTGMAADELVAFPDKLMGIAAEVEEDRAGVILLGPSDALRAGDEVRRTGRVVDTPVGEALLGRVVDALGRPRDGGGPIKTRQRRPIERPAPAIIDRAPVDRPLQTGITAVDAVVPIGRGQRELIVGDRQTGKTTLAVDAILAQHGGDVISVYCAIAQRGTAVARVIETLTRHGAMDRTVVVATTGRDPAGLQYLAPYAATTIAEHFADRGHDVLVVYDDLTRHARAYRETALLLRRPPGREAYPGDIFYVHSRLLERATHLSAERGGGSLTALPIAETEEQNIAAYIPTNLVSITDGQIFLSPRLFRQGQLPAVDVGLSVSRVGGKAQLPAYRAVAGDLRLAHAQFEELERFERYGARLEAARQRELERGRRVRAVLRQPEHRALRVGEQAAVFVAVTEGLFDSLPAAEVPEAEYHVCRSVRRGAPEVLAAIEAGGELTSERREAIRDLAAEVLVTMEQQEVGGADT
jgi:F-type H+-transporting ATPase subunit alpha